MTIIPAKLHHVSRQTQKLEETRRFYVEVLGFSELSRPGFNFPGAWLYGSGIQIHLIDEPFTATEGAPNSRENHIAFQIENPDQAEVVLKERGIAYRRQKSLSGNEQIFFRDPEGWMIELGNYPAEMDK